ncbi:MAG: hypothetical protein K0S45_4505 [Nitrospira sp.]|jgi:hypothetical protein|nr:hypothetical protein [Nitrospira sp.]
MRSTDFEFLNYREIRDRIATTYCEDCDALTMSVMIGKETKFDAANAVAKRQ